MTAHDEQPAPTAREIPADELAEAERYVRTMATHWDNGEVPAAMLDRLLAEYDGRGRERDAARVELDRLRLDLTARDAALKVQSEELERLREDNERLRARVVELEPIERRARALRDAFHAHTGHYGVGVRTAATQILGEEDS